MRKIIMTLIVYLSLIYISLNKVKINNYNMLLSNYKYNPAYANFIINFISYSNLK